jgi:endonuclease/exonuclease/phosphatase (EEP) superfamily protein YafD
MIGGTTNPSSGAWKRRLQRATVAGGWLACALCAWTLLSSRLGITRPFATVAFQAFGVWLLGIAWVALAAAAFLRRRALSAVAALLCIAHLAVVVPLMRRDTIPAWAKTSPTFTIAAANVLVDNKRFADTAAVLSNTNADVLVLVEVTDEWVAQLRASGLFVTYPYQVLHPYTGGGIGSAILSKRPIERERSDLAARRLVHSVDVLVGTMSVQIVACHPQSPNNGSLVPSWIDQIQGLIDVSNKRTSPIVFAGDLNASYLNPPYRDLLATGLHDAHESRGIGFTNSFPIGRGPLPVTRLDHALVSDEIAVLHVGELTIPGSDHRGFVTQLAVKQAAS